MNILLGLDGSAYGFAAIDFVANLLNPSQDTIGLVHSCGPVALTNSDVSEEIIERAQKAVAQVIFDEAIGRLPAGMKARVKTFSGTDRAGTLLVNTANSWPANLIVVGARGLSGFESLLLGSVSNEVVRSAKQPVLVVRPITKKPEQGLRVLVAYDATNAERIAEVLNSASLPAGSVGQVLTVIEPYYAAPLPDWLMNKARDADTEAMSQVWLKEHEQETAAKKTELLEYSKKLPAAFQGQSPLVAEGNAAEQILLAVNREKIDLVIVGKQVSGLLNELLLGSTSRKIVNQAPCSVLVVPGK